MSDSCTFLGILDFSNTQQHLQDFRSCFASSSNCVSFFKSLIVVISYFLVSMAIKGSIFSLILAAFAVITSGKLAAYPCCTQASKSASIVFVAQTDNASTSFHIPLDPGFLILEPLIIFPVIRIFFLLSPLLLLYP